MRSDFGAGTRVTAILPLSTIVFVKIQGKQHYLWRAVDQDGDVVDVFLQHRRNGQAAKRFFKRLLKVYGAEPSFHINQLETESGSCGDSNPHRFFRARSLPLGCNAPLRLGIAQRPHNRINIGRFVVLGH